MLFAPGGLAIAQFQVELLGNLVALVNPVAVIYRGTIATSIVPTISSPATGLYSVSFIVPNNWQNYDAIACNLSGSVNGRAASLFKPTGVVLTLPAAAPDNAAIADILAKVEKLYELEGVDGAVRAKDPIAGVPGYRRSATIRQVITQNDDGSYTIAPEPTP